MCLHIPQLPLDVFRHSGSDDVPLAVCGTGRHSRVLFCNAPAQRQGICPGLPLAAARALSRSLRSVARNSDAERQALESLAGWATQFTPVVSLSPPDALLLEVEGSLHLFGGLTGLLERARHGLRSLGYVARLASAPTPLAALCLARCGRERHVGDVASLPAALAPLPLSVLDWEQTLVDRLQGMGVHRLAELLRLPRAGLARRLEPACVEDLDRLVGRRPDLRPPWRAPERFRRRLVLPAEVSRAEALSFAVRRLVLELCGWLRGRDAAVQQLEICLYHRDRAVTRLEHGLQRRSRDAEHIAGLLRERLERLSLPGPVLELEMRAERPLAMAATSPDLFTPADGDARADLLDRLRARLGDEAVRGLDVVAEHRPEYAWRSVEAGEASACRPAVAGRPLWLLPVPRRLRTRDGRPCLHGPLQLEPGRERVESGWWDGEEVRRDYFVARDSAGACYWIYRELEGGHGWYLQGLFD